MSRTLNSGFWSYTYLAVSTFTYCACIVKHTVARYMQKPGRCCHDLTGLYPHSYTVPAELNTWLPKQKSKQGINLLSGQDSTGKESTHEEQAELANVPREYISYLKPNLTIAMVDDFTKYPVKNIPPPVSTRSAIVLCTRQIMGGGVTGWGGGVIFVHICILQ